MEDLWIADRGFLMGKKKKNKRGKLWIHTLWHVVSVFLVFYILTQVILGVFCVRETSMSPNLSGLVLSNRLSYKVRDPMRGDVIIFQRKDRLLVKRVLGLPGDTVRIWGGRVWIGDTLVQEDYLADTVITDGNMSYQVPDGMYFVLGDNRDVSMDSRTFSEVFVDREKIKGRVFYCLPSLWDFPGKVLVQTKGGKRS